MLCQQPCETSLTMFVFWTKYFFQTWRLSVHQYRIKSPLWPLFIYLSNLFLDLSMGNLKNVLKILFHFSQMCLHTNFTSVWISNLSCLKDQIEILPEVSFSHCSLERYHVNNLTVFFACRSEKITIKPVWIHCGSYVNTA